jgi:hypothetical protein
MQYLTVKKLRADGSIGDDSFAAPCVELEFSFAKAVHLSPGQVALANRKTVTALLDTGADHNLIDEDLVPPEAQSFRAVESAGVGGIRTARAHEISLYFPEAGRIIETAVITMARDHDRQFSMVLGRSFLNETRFVYDGKRGIVDLELLPFE